MTRYLIPELRNLGLNEYEAKVYSTLVGLRKATARDIHEVSRVPRGRIYEILHDLTRRGFIGVEEGSPNSYYTLDTDQVIDHIKEDYISTLEKTREALKSLETKPVHRTTPWFILRSDWAITNHLQALFRRVQKEMVVLCYDPEFLKQHFKLFKSLRKKVTLYIVIPDRELFAGVDLPFYEARGIVRELMESSMIEDKTIQQEIFILFDGREAFSTGYAGTERFAIIGTDTPLIRYIAKSIIERVEEQP